MEEHSPLTMIGALALMLVGSPPLLSPLDEDGASRGPIGVGYAVAAATSLMLMWHGAKGEAHVMQLMFGNILYVSSREIWEFAAAAALVALGPHPLRQGVPLRLLRFRGRPTRSASPRSRFWEMLFYLTLGLAIAFAIRVAGVLLVFSCWSCPG